MKEHYVDTTNSERHLLIRLASIEAGLDPITLTGDILVDTWGALDDPSETDPDAVSATVPSLLRGNLENQASGLTTLGALDDAAWDGTGNPASLIALWKGMYAQLALIAAA